VPQIFKLVVYGSGSTVLSTKTCNINVAKVDNPTTLPDFSYCVTFLGVGGGGGGGSSCSSGR